MQAVFGILTAEDMVVPGIAQWLCEQGTRYPGLARTWPLMVTSFVVRARGSRAVQPEIPSRNATMGAVLFGFAADCGPPRANDDAFRIAQRPEYSRASTTKCNVSTPSEPT